MITNYTSITMYFIDMLICILIMLYIDFYTIKLFIKLRLYAG
jgi:hypothetical protein